MVHKTNDEDVLRITARYVAEIEAGRQPDVSTYLERYPHYAEAILDFVVYYHCVEEDIEQDLRGSAPLSEISAQALDRVHERLFSYTRFSRERISTLLFNNQQPMLPSQLAAQLYLSTDIISLLELRLIDPATLPYELLKRCATSLRRSIPQVQTYFEKRPRHSTLSDEVSVSMVAERFTTYSPQKREDIQQYSFRQVVEESPQLSAEQRSYWLALSERDGV